MATRRQGCGLFCKACQLRQCQTRPQTTRPTAAPLRSFGAATFLSLVVPERMSANMAAFPAPSAFIAGGFAGGPALPGFLAGGGGGPFPFPFPLPFPFSPFALGAGGGGDGFAGFGFATSLGAGTAEIGGAGSAGAGAGACGCDVGLGGAGACRFGTGRGLAMEARLSTSAGATSQAGRSPSLVSPSVHLMCATWPRSGRTSGKSKVTSAVAGRGRKRKSSAARSGSSSSRSTRFVASWRWEALFAALSDRVLGFKKASSSSSAKLSTSCLAR